MVNEDQKKWGGGEIQCLRFKTNIHSILNLEGQSVALQLYEVKQPVLKQLQTNNLTSYWCLLKKKKKKIVSFHGLSCYIPSANVGKSRIWQKQFKNKKEPSQNCTQMSYTSFSSSFF